MELSDSEQKIIINSKINFISFPRFLLIFLISIFLTMSSLMTYLVVIDGKINLQEIVLDFPLFILTLILDTVLLIVLFWIWFNPIEIVYERNTKSRFVRKSNIKKNLISFDNSNPLRIILFGESEPVIVKNVKPLSSWKDLFETLKLLGILSLTHLDKEEMNTLIQYRELYKKKPKLPKLLIFLDNNDKQILPPIGNILESGIWTDLHNENYFKEKIPLKIEFKEVSSSLRSYWGYWIFAQLNWELNLRNDINDLKRLS
ncbi:MAG: hypothetical protein HeimC3_20340 [Candidatus Heimdallarchaeota archaeon LC_3]|nr:MAG: hypothetical protein HeimC3_20340 [Candidatus Heimdallarchaeota archaeon LC_3]